MIEKKEKIFLGVVALYIIIALCFYTFNSPENFIAEILVGGLIVLVMFIKSKKLYVGIREILLIATVISWGIITEQVKFALATAILWFIYIYITKFLMYEGINRGIAEKLMWWIIITLTVGFTIHAVVVSIAFFSKINFFSFYDSVYRDVNYVACWDDLFCGCSIPRTQITIFYVTVFVSTLPLCISRTHPKYKVLIIGIDIFLLYANICNLAGRLPFVIFFVVSALQVLIFIIEYKKEIKVLGKRKVFAGVLLVLLIFICIYFVCKKNETVVKAVVSVVHRDGGILHNVRFKWQCEVLKNIFEYPLGVYPNNPQEVFGFSYTHNVWVDMALFAGLIPFACFFLYTVYSIVDVFCFLKYNANIFLKMIVIGLYIGYVLIYMVEPAFYASVEFIVPWLIVNIIMCTYTKSARIRLNTIT